MENGLALPEVSTVAKYADDKAFDKLSSGNQFLPRLMLYTSSSDACKEGKIQIGRWGLSLNKDTIVDLGIQLDVLVCSYRLKAMELGEQILSFFNPQHKEFLRIVNKAAEASMNGAMAGPEFLVWIPSQDKFCTLFMASPTMKREAPNLKALKGKAATLKVRLIDNKKHKWHGPVVTQCSTLDVLPNPDLYKEEVMKFCNPAESEIENADASMERPR